MANLRKSSLTVRQATIEDIEGVHELGHSVYGDLSLTRDMIRGQIMHFPEGQFVAEYDGIIVGHAATFVISGDIALKPHTWKEITGGGFASRHNMLGDYLYGMEVCVSNAYRRLRIGQRLYDARKNLCQEFDLKGIIFGGRMPSYSKAKNKQLAPEDYVQKAIEQQVQDPVIKFQLRNGFEVIGVLKNYLPTDTASKGYATHMIWYNPTYHAEHLRRRSQPGRLEGTVRVAAVQFQVRKVDSFEHFERQLEYWIDIASGYRADFICFPEMISLAMLSVGNQRLKPEQAVERVTQYTNRYIDFMSKMAVSYNINIIAGSHPTKTEDGRMRNVSFICLRDGSVHTQGKIHPTPNERYWWNMTGSDELNVVQTDCGPVAVQICYDSEFPEPCRTLADKGALILFVPYCTDERQGHMRVRYCCQARAIENQIYVITAGVVGNLPDVENMDIHYAQSAIITPCDFPFARDGIMAEAPANTETIIFSDLRLDSLLTARNSGTVKNLKDRRFDLYSIEWNKKPATKLDVKKSKNSCLNVSQYLN